MTTSTARRFRRALLALACVGAALPINWCHQTDRHPGFSTEPVAAIGADQQPATSIEARAGVTTEPTS